MRTEAKSIAAIKVYFSAPIYNMLGYMSYLSHEYDYALQYFNISESLDKVRHSLRVTISVLFESASPPSLSDVICSPG